MDPNLRISTSFDGFIPPQAESIVSTHSFAFIILNTFTLGIYAAAEAISKQNQIRILEVNQRAINQRLKVMMKEFDKLEDEVCEHQKEVSNESIDLDYDKLSQKSKNLNNRINNVGTEFWRRKRHNANSIGHIVSNAFRFMGNLAANILTAGIYGLIQNHVLKYKVICLQEQDEFSEKQVETNKARKIDRLASQLKETDEYIELKKHFKVISGTDDGQARIDFAKLTSRHDKLTSELQELRVQHATVLTEKVALGNEKAVLERTGVRLQAQVRDAVDQEARLRADQARIVREKDLAVQGKAATERDLVLQRQLLQNAQTQSTNLTKQVRDLEAELRRRGPAAAGDACTHQQVMKELGPITPAYVKREEDGAIIGVYDTDKAKAEEERSAWYNRYAECRGVVDVVKSAFDYSFDELVKMGNDKGAGGKPKLVNFNKSGNILGEHYARNMQAVYRFAMWDIISGSTVERADCHGFQLRINGDVSIVPSEPRQVLVKRIDQATKAVTYVVETQLSREDDFTATGSDLDAKGLDKGTDAVSAAWILHNRLTAEQRIYVLHLLLEPLIEEENPALKAARAFIATSTQEAHLVKTAVRLISTMGYNIERKWQKNALIPNWQDKADDWEVEPFRKDKFVDIPADKPGETPMIPWDFKKQMRYFNAGGEAPKTEDELDYENTLNDPRADADTKAIMRVLLDDCFEARKAIGGRKTPLGAHLEATAEQQKLIFSRLNEMLENPLAALIETHLPTDANRALNLLARQYHIYHDVIHPHYCLFSNLFVTITHDRTLLTDANIQQLRNAMANYLDDPKNREEFEGYIRGAHKVRETVGYTVKERDMNVEEYQYWLRNGNNPALPIDAGNPGLGTKAISIEISNAGVLEIKLFAHVMGIRVNLFISSRNAQALKLEDGLMIPESEAAHLGPKTAKGEAFAVYNNVGSSFYVLEPKLRAYVAADRSIKANVALENAIRIRKAYSALADKPHGY